MAARRGVLVLGLMLLSQAVTAAGVAVPTELERFQSAWEAARRGNHAEFARIKDSLLDYRLYPYLQYEDFRNRKGRVDTAEMAAFLDAHRGWAFEPGLRRAWLKTLGERGRWSDLLAHADGVDDTGIACQRNRARIILGQTDGVLEDIRALWAVGHSQPKECDVPFTWMIKTHGIPDGLAWQRIFLAMEANDRALVKYLARFVPAAERRWLDEWYTLSRSGYARIGQLRRWQDTPSTRRIAALSLQRLARRDAAPAAKTFDLLDANFAWPDAERQSLWREIALWSAVSLDGETHARMLRVPPEYRDAQLLEWWARFALAREDWAMLEAVIGQMGEGERKDERWRYWLAQAQVRAGQDPGQTGLPDLASEASYYGFLSADELGRPYNICSLEPRVDDADIGRIAMLDGFARALELRKAGLDNWANAEWALAAGRVGAGDLVAVAALAQREGWHDRVIFALGDSGHRRFYTWRFPLAYESEIMRHAQANGLDPAWVFGTVRAESAMVEGARSSANALGLMQVTPATGRRVAKKHGLPWRGNAQLQTAAGNLPIGAAYMADLVQEYSANPVLVSGAYNAGPNAVKNWLDSRPRGEAAIWAETLPYFETRDYIPRVLAFTTIYAWRLGEPVSRISSRMPHLESGKIRASGFAGVECREQVERTDAGK